MVRMLPSPASLPVYNPTLPPTIWPSVQSLSLSARLTRVVAAVVPAVGVLANANGVKAVTVRLAVAGNTAARPDLVAETTNARVYPIASLSAHRT